MAACKEEPEIRANSALKAFAASVGRKFIKGHAFGHQAYPHKIITGRRDRIRTIRQGGGLSGFTKRAESAYDPFGAAHSSTSIPNACALRCLSERS